MKKTPATAGRVAPEKMETGDRIVRTSLSLSKLVFQWAHENALKQGFNANFSAYVTYLIRRDKERQDSTSRDRDN